MLLKLFPVILGAVQSVEAAISLPAAGKAKLDLVLGTVSDVYASGVQIGIELPADRVMGLISQCVSRIVSTFNALGIFKKSV
ncbi:MAG: hypothetical protein M3Z09_01030 [Acidobacteriota bacterium]|nr:hypothetical protein [Acidobacteriota bacterium]